MSQLLEVKLYGCPILAQKAEPVTELTDEVRDFIDQLVYTLYATEGVGLAAPQVGVSKRIFVCDKDFYQTEEKNPLVLINPEFTAFSGEQEYEEGCLSIPNIYEKIIRFQKVTIKYRDLDWKEQELQAEDTLAVILQHEFDHLEGKTFVDRISKIKKMSIAFKLNRIAQKGRAMSSEMVVLPS